MKILHISTMSKGGAFLAANRLNDALIAHNIESKILVLETPGENTNAIPYLKHSNSFLYKLFYKLKKSILYRFKIGIGKYWRKHDSIREKEPCIYSFPISTFRVENHQLVKQWADIIHLHWCNNFINYPTFFKCINKPIVWTFHDISFKYGGFHFDIDFKRHYQAYCELEDALFKIKEKALRNKSNITLLALSKEIKHEIESVSYLSNKQIILLPNIINTKDFIVLDKQECRKYLKIVNKKVIIFVSENVDTESKGLNDLKIAVRGIFNNDDILLCIVGNFIKKDNSNDLNLLYTGKISDSNILNMYYSAADILVVPSYQESFSLTTFESMSCGTPVVAYPCGAITEYINENNGILCKTKDPNELKKCIQKALSINYNPYLIRNHIVNQINPEILVPKYMLLYNKIEKDQLLFS